MFIEQKRTVRYRVFESDGILDFKEIKNRNGVVGQPLAEGSLIYKRKLFGKWRVNGREKLDFFRETDRNRDLIGTLASDIFRPN